MLESTLEQAVRKYIRSLGGRCLSGYALAKPAYLTVFVFYRAAE